MPTYKDCYYEFEHVDFRTDCETTQKSILIYTIKPQICQSRLLRFFLNLAVLAEKKIILHR